MGDDSPLLRDDGFIQVPHSVKALTYHNNLNVILVRTTTRAVLVVDVNSGVILQSTCLGADSGGVSGLAYAPGADRLFAWDSSGVSARTDYNGVLLLHTALQLPLQNPKPKQKIKLELILSEAVLLLKSLEILESGPTIEGLSSIIQELKTVVSREKPRKSVKAQKWTTVTIELPHSILRSATQGIVQELIDRTKRIPALAIASAIGQRTNELVQCSQDDEPRSLMYSEAERKQTFKRWPHMDYKWALPARMAQAGFYHQPSPNGDDRAMCFICLVCLVCWEKSDEPWVEHERHSPSCPFVRGEYTHNVPISVTNATACGVSSPNVTIVSKNNNGDLIASGSADGKVNIWKFDCGIKLYKYISITAYDSIFSGMLCNDTHTVWTDSLDKDPCTYAIELTAMAFLGTSAMSIKNQTPGMDDSEAVLFETKPTLICGVVISRSGAEPPGGTDVVGGKELFEGTELPERPTPPDRMLFLIAYDMRNNAGAAPDAKPANKKPARPDANIYDEMCVLDSDDDATSIVCTNLIEEHFSKVIELTSPPSKEIGLTVWDPKKFIKHLKTTQQPLPALADIPEAAPATMLDFADKIAQLKTWASSNLTSTGKTDAVDSALDEMDPITHYLNLNGPIVSDFKCYETVTDAAVGDAKPGAKLGTQTVVADNNNDRYDPTPAPEDVPTPALAVHCLRLPDLARLSPDACVTHILPLEDKARLLVVVADREDRPDPRPDADRQPRAGESSMDVDEEAPRRCSYLLVYRLHPAAAAQTVGDMPLDVHELAAYATPADLCRVPAQGHDDYTVAAVGADGALRVYSFPGMRRAAEQLCPQGRFTSVSYCLGAERLSAGTSAGALRFYGVGRGTERAADPEDDEPAIAAHDPGGPDPSAADLRRLATVAGAYGANAAVPYTAVVPGFWCELSAAQRSRRDRPADRVWRLQNASSAWDEHALELTLPRSASLAHVDFGFSLHAACGLGRPPAVRVSLLKQGAAGLAFGEDEEGGRTNAEILAGPLELSAGLDASREAGALVLTSPRLYRARGRTFLVHVQTVRDNDDRPDDGEDRSAFVGCDWIHQITMTVRTSPRSEEPGDRARRIAMLESDSFLDTLLRIGASRVASERRGVALDLLVWVVSVRLQRLRLAAVRKDEPDALLPGEAEQIACVNILEKYVKDLIKNCILCAKRSLAKKCVKILLITDEGEKQLPNPGRVTFGARLRECLRAALPLLGACESPGAMRWFLALASKVLDPNILLPAALQLLEKLSRVHHTRDNLHHRLLRARFGLYGLPLERQIFEVEGPDLSKSAIPTLTYTSVLTGETSSSSSIPKPDCKLKNLYNFAGDVDEKACPAGVAWWTEHQGLAALGAGLSEVQPLHVSCHVASEGTKLEAARQPAPMFCADPELWASLKEGQVKVLSTDQVSLDDADNSSLMDCDPKVDIPDENIFKEQESCSVPWAQLVVRPPLHTLLVERMHSGARRYVILDFGHPVRLTDVVIPACADLVTLGVDIWMRDEDLDNVKLAYAMDIATKHLVLTDIQPPPICRYMKITTIGRYGMSAMKCKIPLGWFYGEVAQISNVPSSVSALHVLYEDLTCKFRLATGKLIDLLNPFLDLYYGNVSHMMAYFNTQTENDPKVTAAYQECIDIQQQLHFVHVTLKKLQSDKECDDKLIDFVEKDNITSEMLLERACTDKLRVMIENVVDLTLHLYFEKSDSSHEVTSASWCSEVSPLLWSCSARTAASLAALLPRLCARASWWGAHLANTLHGAFTPHDAGPHPLHRILVLTMYMCRRNPGAVAPALADQLLTLLAEDATPALIAAVLAALSAAFDTHHSRWEWVSGGRPVSLVPALAPAEGSPRADLKPHRRKLHKKLIYQMQELENARREAQVVLEERTRGGVSCRVGGRAPVPLPAPPRPLVPRPAARALALALTRYMLRATHQDHADTLMLCAKVIGRLCLTAGGPPLLDATCIQGLVRLAVTLPPWPRHAVTNLIQDIVESESLTPQDEARPAPFNRPRKVEEPTAASAWKTLRKARNALSGRTLLCHILKHHEEELKGGESDDSDDECKKKCNIKKDDSFGEKIDLHISTSSLPGNISNCGDARLETCTEAWSETLARSLLLSGCDALATAVRSPVTSADSDVTTPSPPTEPATFSLPNTFVAVFRSLALEFPYQADSTFLENIVNLWLILNGSPWGFGRTGSNSWVGGLMTVVDVPKVRLPADVVEAILCSLVNLEQVSLRCWILCLQTFAWISNQQNLDQPGCTMGEVILKSDNFVPAIVKFINMNVDSDGAVFGSEAFLSGVTNGAGAGAASTLYVTLSRVLSGRGAAAAGAALRAVAGVSDRAAPDLRHSLLRAALPLAPQLSAAHAAHAAALIHAVANECASWISSVCDRAWGGASGPRGSMDAAGDVRLGELLADGCARRHAQRRPARVQLLRYCMALLAVPSDIAPTPSTSASQTDESKQQAQRCDINADDEHKQQAAAKPPSVADIILQQPHVMGKFFKVLSLCENRNSPHLLNPNPESSLDTLSLKDEIYWLVAQIGEAAAQPDLLVTTLLDYLRADPSIYLSESLQNLITRLLKKPHFHNLFIERGGLEIAIDKMVAYHDNQPTTTPGLISSLMNYLKLPVLVSPTNNTVQPGKKCQSISAESASGLYNYAPLCTITCDNPTAQVAEVLLGAGPGSAAATAARRVRSAAWSYHFFTADDTSLALLLTLPHAVMLHELQLQPHLTSLTTCPGAVAIEAGCFGALTPLGPPQNTAGLSFIRLVLAQPIVCTHVQVRLYKPRDSSNMGLLQLRLLGSPAFTKAAITAASQNQTCANRWACIVSGAVSRGVCAARWAGVIGGARALAGLVLAGGAEASHAYHALLAAATATPAARPAAVEALLRLDAAAHAHAFQSRGSRNAIASSTICELLQRLCETCSDGSVQAYLRWFSDMAERYLRTHAPPSAALVQTLASILWTVKERNSLDNLEQLINDEMFELLFTWLSEVPDNSILKRALDAVLCSMCYIRPELFRSLLEQLYIPTSPVDDEIMEGVTDDGKVEAVPPPWVPSAAELAAARGLQRWQLGSVAAAAMSPAATPVLLRSPLLPAAAHLHRDFCITKLEEIKQESTAPDQDVHMSDCDTLPLPNVPDLQNMKSVCIYVDWLRMLCAEKRLKDWIGTHGVDFWKPLLMLLCYPRHNENTWQEGQLFEELEENTIRLFAEMTLSHPDNQKLFASTLHSVLETLHETDSVGISGFTRALMLRLLLTAERCEVSLRWEGAACSPAATPGQHPALPATVHVLPSHTTIGALLRDRRAQQDPSKISPTICLMSSALGTGVMRSASDTGVGAGSWELSLAAGSASKDRRAKDLKGPASCLKGQYGKKKLPKTNNDANTQTQELRGLRAQLMASSPPADAEPCVIVRVAGLSGVVPHTATLAQLAAALPPAFGPQLRLTLARPLVPSILVPPPAANIESSDGAGEGGSSVLREFGACGGLALVAARLPRPTPLPSPAPAPALPPPHMEPDWVKLEDFYDEVLDINDGHSEAAPGSAVPGHALVALAMLLKLPGYAAALLDEGPRAVHLLRLLLGVGHDEDGRSIAVNSGGSSLGSLPFLVVARLLQSAARSSDSGRTLRRMLLPVLRLVLACLAVFTHHRPERPANQGESGAKPEEKSHHYWAKGTGFGTGSTQQSWNVEQALHRQRTEEEYVTVLLLVVSSYIDPALRWPPEEEAEESAPTTDTEIDLPEEFIELLAASTLVPAICSYLRNDSVLDMSRHIPLYLSVLACARALWSARARRLQPALGPLPRLLRQMSATTASYATKLRMNKKEIIMKLSQYHKKLTTARSSEQQEEDEGLATLIADIQATSKLMSEQVTEEDSLVSVNRPLTAASREARYIEVMKKLQFESFEMIEECPDNAYRFKVPYHFESTVRAAGDRSHPARMKRLAQEAATLASSLPLSFSSSVFVRTDTDRLDVMKVLITGPSDTPYANGCFVLDVYFPAEYPAVPMMVNLDTTGRHSVRFNPNLYNDGKVCLSVLNTWHGRPEEKWNAHTSSFLQVLVSIQSLILVPEPYFNEPGYERSRGTRAGNNASTEYNSNIYQANVRWAMLDHLRHPEPCFKEVIQKHFWVKRNEIMQTISNWITELEAQSGDDRTQRTVQLNLMALKRHYVKMQEELAKLPVPAGLEDMDEPFQLPAAPVPGPGGADQAEANSAGDLATDMDATSAQLMDEIYHDMEKIVSQVLE